MKYTFFFFEEFANLRKSQGSVSFAKDRVLAARLFKPMKESGCLCVSQIY